MSRFLYQVKDSRGRADSGVLAASTLEEASRLLRRDGKTIVSLRQESAALAVNAPKPKKKIKRDDIIFFATQLAVMVDTGVPLTEALDSIKDQSDHDGMQAVLSDICEQVKSGVAFSACLEKHPKVFNKLFVALMRASEASGTMGQMLQRLSEYMEQERDTRKKVKGAMTYPMCMLSFCVLVVVALLVFVLPRFEKIYATKNAVLPAPTQFLLSLSKFMVGYWPFILVGLAAAVAGTVFYVRTPEGRIAFDGLRLRVPILGQMSRKACLARSLRTMATMVSTGVSMLEGLEITSKVAGNYHYERIWSGLAEKVKEGSTIAAHLAECKLVPRTVTQMISAGERTGRLANVMNRVATFCEDDLKVAVKTITNMIEPAMIVIMGLIVGGIAVALLLPVFSISKVVAH